MDVSEGGAQPDDVSERIRLAEPDLVLVALGAPKQELWSHLRAESLKPAVLIGVGASLDFVAGIQKRAPRWMSNVGLEWLYRLGQEPRRLAARYLLRDPEFCLILLRQLAQGPGKELGP
ncbi:MAG: WecB/TagA/CpsF family glycosyltransferase [Pseudomonadota bacterium]